jgi:hypothetical protein
MTLFILISSIYDTIHTHIGNSWPYMNSYQQFMTLFILISAIYDTIHTHIGNLWPYLYSYRQFMTLYELISAIYDTITTHIGNLWPCLYSYRQFMTLFILAAHRLHTVIQCDQLIVMDAGSVVEQVATGRPVTISYPKRFTRSLSKFYPKPQLFLRASPGNCWSCLGEGFDACARHRAIWRGLEHCWALHVILSNYKWW